MYAMIVFLYAFTNQFYSQNVFPHVSQYIQNRSKRVGENTLKEKSHLQFVLDNCFQTYFTLKLEFAGH